MRSKSSTHGQIRIRSTSVRDALKYAELSGFDTVLFDTAGRLQIDDYLMNELVRIKDQVDPREILFVADAMTGQEAVNVAARLS